MVGYIEDATIESYVRVRFDAGFTTTFQTARVLLRAVCCNSASARAGLAWSGRSRDRPQVPQLIIDGQYAVTPRVAVFAAIPLRFVQPQTFLGQTLPHTFESSSGFSDIRAGAKAAVVSTGDTVLTAQVQGYFQSGDAKKGLGTDHASLEATLLLNQTLSDRVAIESQFGDWHPFGGSSAGGVSYSGDVLFYGIGPSFELVKNSQLAFAPVIELVGWHVLGGQAQPAGTVVPADGTNIVNLKFGARTTLTTSLITSGTDATE
jgi:hypothetical protein